jgi:hypothetical protein
MNVQLAPDEFIRKVATKLAHSCARSKVPSESHIAAEQEWLFASDDLAIALNGLLDIAAEQGASYSIERCNGRLLITVGNLGSGVTAKMVWRPSGTGSSCAQACESHSRCRLEPVARARKCGRFITVSGGDGTGKTSVINSLRGCAGHQFETFQFRLLYRNALVYRMFVPSIRALLQWRRKAKISMAKVDDQLCYLVQLVALIRFPYLAFRVCVRGPHVVDRYFCDFVLKNYRIKSKRTLVRNGYKILAPIAPTPFAIILLDAPPDVILKRKSVSMAAADYALYRSAVHDYAQRNKVRYFVYLNTGQPISECVEFLLEHQWLSHMLNIQGAGFAQGRKGNLGMSS